MRTEPPAVGALLLAGVFGAGLSTVTLLVLEHNRDRSSDGAAQPCQCGSGVLHPWTSTANEPLGIELVRTSHDPS